MNRGLFVSVILDEDVHVLVAEMVRRYGFEATTARDQGCLGVSDAKLLQHAVSMQCALVTHNRADFERLAQGYLESGRSHCGLILAVRRSPYEIARRLLQILNHVTADEMLNQLYYI
jgi:predicted nuclease of predicted toxin-antitoxin system